MKTAFDTGLEIIGDRSLWERKQRLYYQMRHDGLRRLNKPQWGADQHLPLIDMNIAALKPFWSAQTFGGQRLCDFISLKQQERTTTESAADYHDFQLKNFSNFRIEMESSLDTMLLRGRGVLLATNDPANGYRLKFKNIDPLYILIDQMFDDFTDADAWIYVERLSIGQYQRNRNYNQDPTIINQIRGRGDFTLESIELDKQLREGVTHTADEKEIILWHHWLRTPGGYSVNTFSPQNREAKIRSIVGCPYKVDGKVSQPFFSFAMEVKDSGWYSPRGVAELNAAFETYACTLWNNKTDAMAFGNRPLFTGDKEIPNSANMRFQPGEYVPGGITAIAMPQPAYSFDQEMNFARGLAEQRSKVPDFGIQDQSGKDSGKPRTATENNRIAGLQNVGADYNGEIFRSVRLQKLYRHTWGMLVQFQPERLAYYIGDDLKELPVQALHDSYLVVPLGGPANKNEIIQRAGQRYEAFKGLPNVNQDELVRDVLNADDPRLVRRLLIPTNSKQQSEAYEEALNMGACMLGYPAPVLPDEDHATRIMVIIGFLHKLQSSGTPVDPNAMQKIQQHLAQHMMYLKQLQPQAFKQTLQAIQQMEAGGQPGPMAAGAAAGPSNISPMPPASGSEQLATGSLP